MLHGQIFVDSGGIAVRLSVALVQFLSRDDLLKVGFERLGDSGRSEFLTVYGGLEMGLALLFLLPWLIPQSTLSVLWGCVLIHGSLVLFRTISLGLYPKVSTMTYQLAAGEWLILLLAIAALWSYRTLPAANS